MRTRRTRRMIHLARSGGPGVGYVRPSQPLSWVEYCVFSIRRYTAKTVPVRGPWSFADMSPHGCLYRRGAACRRHAHNRGVHHPFDTQHTPSETRVRDPRTRRDAGDRGAPAPRPAPRHLSAHSRHNTPAQHAQNTSRQSQVHMQIPLGRGVMPCQPCYPKSVRCGVAHSVAH